MKAKESLARNTGWMMVSYAGRVGIQGLYFVALARALGPSEYGVFSGALSIATMVSPFAGLGMGYVMVSQVAKEPHAFRAYWNQTLTILLLSSVALVPLTGALGYAVLGQVSFQLMLVIALAELLFARAIDIAGQAFQAVERLGLTAALQIAAYLGRLLTVLAYLWTVPIPTFSSWLFWYLGGTALAGVTSVVFVSRVLGQPRWGARIWLSDVPKGLSFSVGLAARSIYTDIDKAMLTRLSTLEATGQYGVAYRVINLAIAPVQSLLAASFPRFFQHGAQGVKGSLSFARKLLPLSAIYGAVVSMGIWIIAPLLPLVMGQAYTDSVAVVRWLALVPFLQSVGFLAADTLTGAGLQRVRSVLQILGAVLNVLINLWLIPKYSWLAAAWSTLVVEAFLALSMWLCAVLGARKPGRV